MITEIKGSDLPLEAVMKIFIKKAGFDQFFEAFVSTRRSNRGYTIATLRDVSEISRSKFYRQDNAVRFIFQAVKNGYEIHEIGNKNFFERMDAKYDV